MVIQRGLLKSHMAGCAARDVKCCKTGCGLELKRGDVAEHAMNGCEERQMKCGDCGTLVRFRNKTVSPSLCREISKDVCLGRDGGVARLLPGNK